MAMTWNRDGPTVKNIKSCNKAIQELKATANTHPTKQCGWSSPMPVWQMMVKRAREVFSWHSRTKTWDEEPGAVGRLSINSWKRHRLRRAVKASLGSEALAMDDGLAELEWIKALFCELVVPGTCVCDGTRYGSDETVTIVRVKDENDAMAITDARALYDLFHRPRQLGCAEGHNWTWP